MIGAIRRTSVRRLPPLLSAVLIGLVLSLAGAARADFEAGWSAYLRKDYQAAIDAWTPLAEAGDSRAQYNLGYLYRHGKGVAEDKEKAVAWWSAAAAQGLQLAQHSLAVMYFGGEGVTRDVGKAVQWLTKAAEGGYARSQYTLGKMYNEGLGVPRDDQMAVRWMRAAADQGEYRAQYNLGKIYRDGRGVEKSDEQATYWLRTAAERGYAKAQNHIGARHARGEGVPRDDVEAYVWVTLAAEQGDAEAILNQRILTARMTPQQVSEAQGRLDARRAEIASAGGKAANDAGPVDAAGANLDTAPAASRPPATSSPSVASTEESDAAPAPAQAPPAPAPKTKPAASSSPAGATSVAAVPGGRFWTQLGATRSEEASNALWGQLSTTHGAVLADLDHEVYAADLGAGRGIYYRLVAGPFESQGAAGRVCASLRQAGAACFVTKR